MARTGKQKRFLLFAVVPVTGRKDFIGSFDSKHDAIGEATRLNAVPEAAAAPQWQVYDNAVSEIVAQAEGR